jgi:ABC-2 type transport system ATP-binding protein
MHDPVAGIGPGVLILIVVVVGGLGYAVLHRKGRSGPPPSDTTWSPSSSTSPPPGTTLLPPDTTPSSPGTNFSPPGDLMPRRTDVAVVPRRKRRPAPAEGQGLAVETHGLTKRFGSDVAVDDVDLAVPRGRAFAYLGPNGAGKTTLMRTLLGLTRADAGTMSLLGLSVPSERRQALARVGAIVDEPRFHGHLTGRENLRLLAAARGGDADTRIMPSLTRVGLADRADDKVTSYSMGMRQRLGVAACMLGDPDLLILDEPMNGLDPAGMHEMRQLIESFVDEGRTVMLSSHLLDEVERTCDAVAIVDHGHIIRQGSIDELVHGASAVVVHVDCSDPAAALKIIQENGIGTSARLTDSAVDVRLATDSSREGIAEVVRRLVHADVSVYGLEQVRTSLEDWFLTVTSRLGGES